MNVGREAMVQWLRSLPVNTGIVGSIPTRGPATTLHMTGIGLESK